MIKKYLIAGNWKMNKNIGDSVKLAKEISECIGEGFEDRDVLICPSFTSLYSVSQIISQNLLLGAQNCCYENSGAFTGEVSPEMLKETGCNYAIVGHSERRHTFNEDNRMVNKRLRNVIDSGLKGILCVGETEKEYDNNQTLEVISNQIRGSLEGFEDISDKVVLAYEPVWAIGTGKTATPEQAQKVHQFIRQELENLYGKSLAENLIIQYGGSVKPENCAELFKQKDIDGFLVGNASLNSTDFLNIVKSVKN